MPKTVSDYLYDADSPEDGLYHFEEEVLQNFLRQYRSECEECTHCMGDGYQPGHDPNDPHINGCSNCPIPVECEYCEGTGIVFKSAEEKKEPVSEEVDDFDLPF